MSVVIEGYLTEAKLSDALKQIVGSQWIDQQVKLPGSLFKWDMAFRKNDVQVLVEFDGDEHYRNSLKIKVDREKDRLAASQGNLVVRVPYWVQLDNLTTQHCFGLSANIQQDFPHGFITTKLFPASFCELGIERFGQELDALPCPVRDAVLASLRNRINEHGHEYVLPASLGSLIN